MNLVKRILSILALVCMAVFVAAVLVLLLIGQLGQHPVWIYGPLAAFLMFGLSALAIHKLQQFVAEQRQKKEE